MYYLNRQLFTDYLQLLSQTSNQMDVLARVPATEWTFIHRLAQERLLHLVMESVTDIGHLLIDSFMMRDAGSYDDIVLILHEEHVISVTDQEQLLELVRLKTTLTKTNQTRLEGTPHPLLLSLPAVISDFTVSTQRFVNQELKNIGIHEVE